MAAGLPGWPRCRHDGPEGKEVPCNGMRFRRELKADFPERKTDEMTTPQTPDLATIKGRQQKAWSSGDYGKVGVTLLIMGEQLAEAVPLSP